MARGLIKCPNCGEVFRVDESEYSAILKQIKDEEFEKEKSIQVELEMSKANNIHREEIVTKDNEIASLKTQLEIERRESTNELNNAINKVKIEHQESIQKKEKEVKDLENKLLMQEQGKESEIKLAIEKAKGENQALISQKEKEIAEKELLIQQLSQQMEFNLQEAKNDQDVAISKLMLEHQGQLSEKTRIIQELEDKISLQDRELEMKLKLEVEQIKSEHQNKLNEKETEISKLKQEIIIKETEKEMAVTTAIQEKNDLITKKDIEIVNLTGRIDNNNQAFELREKNLREGYEKELKSKDEQIEYYKDMKMKLSTKMLGESLEQHCQIEFNRIRSMGFQTAYFEKDNNIKSGSKGDFIFRDYGQDGTEYISIMFEMKNEADTTSTKKKNEDFFKELDKDRKDKNCEYAILVSLLEPENELYNSGIVDVSYKYEKMYVIRPQFFVPIITLLRNAAANSLKYRYELDVIRNQNIDISNFEAEMNDFKDKFARNYRLASERFKNAVDEIDKSINHLQKIKENLLASENNLRLANNKAEDLSIKKLTSHNPTMKKMFEDLADKGEVKKN